MRKMPFRTDLAVELRSKIFGEIEGVKYPMDERVLIREIMEEEHIIV